jgi:hypothetical protein
LLLTHGWPNAGRMTNVLTQTLQPLRLSK